MKNALAAACSARRSVIASANSMNHRPRSATIASFDPEGSANMTTATPPGWFLLPRVRADTKDATSNTTGANGTTAPTQRRK